MYIQHFLVYAVWKFHLIWLTFLAAMTDVLKVHFFIKTVHGLHRVGQIKRGQCSFFRCSKARFTEFWFLAGEITVHVRTSRSIKIKYFSPDGVTNANDFLCSSILAVYFRPTHFYITAIGRIPLRRSSCDKGVTGGQEVEFTPLSGRIPEHASYTMHLKLCTFFPFSFYLFSSFITPICVMFIVDSWLFDLLHYYIILMYMCYYGKLKF